MTTTIFPRINFIKDFGSRLQQRIANGRVAMFFNRVLDLFTDATLDLNFAEDKTLDSKVTFTRASSGTYVGSDGLIKTTPVNLLTYSEEFDNNAQWTKISGGGGVAPTVTANAGTAPDGTNTADRIQVSTTATAGTDYSLVRQIVSTTGVHTYSVYLKSNTGSNQQVLVGWNSSVGAVVTVTPEWQRFSLTKTQTSFECDIGVSLDTTNISDASIDVLAWGAQLEEGTTATDYIPTTSTISGAPRFDHDPVTNESLGLLIEEARTNFLSHSEGSDAASGSNLGTQATGTIENILTPRGTVGGVRKITPLDNTTVKVWRMGDTTSGTPNTTYTGSIWVKTVDGGTTDFLLDVNDDGVTSITATDAWQRISTSGSTTGTARFLDVQLNAATDAIYLWGAQLEEGSFPTSYIPTSGTTVTRAADVAEITGANFSSWYNQEEGTLFSEGKRLEPSKSSYLYSFSDGTSANRLLHYPDAFALYMSTGGAQQAQLPSSAYQSGAFVKTAIGVAGNDCRLVSDGVTQGSDTTVLMPTISQLNIGSDRAGFGVLNGHIKRFAYFPTRLTDEQLTELTQ